MNITRQPRPLGLSLLLTNIHNKQYDDKTLLQLIDYTFNNAITINNKQATLETIANLTNQSTHRILKLYLQYSSRMADLMGANDINILSQGLIFQAFLGGLETRAQIKQQRQVLQASQNSMYTPYLTTEVNKILDIEMNANDKLFKMGLGLKQTQINPNSLPQLDPLSIDSKGDTKGIGVNEAVRLLDSKGHTLLTYSEDTYQDLHSQHELSNLPQVIANQQKGNKEDAHILNSKQRHRERRVKELGIDEESSI